MSEGIDCAGNMYVDNRYDTKGRIVKQYNASRKETSIKYEEEGTRAKVITTDAEGNEKWALFNASGQIIKEQDKNGHVTQYGYDDKGRQVKKVVYGKNRATVAKKMFDISGRIKSNSYEIVEKRTFGELMG